MINKYFLITATFCVLSLSGESFSKPGPIYNSSNMLIGYFDGKGNITGSGGSSLGNIGPGGVVYDTSDTPIGQIDESGNITGGGGISLGNIGAGGVVYDTSDAPVGQIDGSGNVTGKGGISLGQVTDPRIGALMLLGVIKMH